MGAVPWFYVVPYQRNIRRAMLELREREFRAGRYHPVVAFPQLAGVSPGAQHRTIEAARAAADADGTRSIVDIDDIDDEPAEPDDPQYGVVTPVDPTVLQGLYGTPQPTRQMVEDMAFLEDAERGTGVYIVLFERGQPTEICFAGCSYD